MDEIKKIYDAGVVGAGGAGFPTHIKFNTKAKTLLINAAECEPLLHSDQYEMENFADEIIQGILIGKKILQADDAIIGIKSKHKKSVQSLEKAIKKINAPISICQMESFYPAGDEQGLIYQVLGIALKPGSIPISEGIVVSNVTTIRNVYLAINGKSVVQKTVTVTGEVKSPTVITVPVGMSILECIDKVGGTKINRYAIILGGPMMGRMVLYDDIKNEVVTKTTGGIIVLEEDHPLVTRKLQSIEHIKNQASSACIQCRFCTELCPRYLMGHPLHPHEVMKAFGSNADLGAKKLLQANLCCECGICELFSCPMGLSPRLVNAKVKQILREGNVPRQNFESYGENYLSSYRKIPTDQLARKISIDKYYQIHDFEYKNLTTDKVSIRLSQHIGKKATPIVKVGDKVTKGQVIGCVDFEQMGALVHSSVTGVVKEINDLEIKIKASDTND